MNNNYENQKVECVSLSGELGQKLTFFMIGCGIGAVTALLFAPKPGRELRDDIADLAGKGYEKTLVMAGEMKHRSAQFYETTKEKGSEVLDVVSAGASAIKKEVTSDIEKIGSIVEGSRKTESTYARPEIV
ncbi:hypothetical protein BH24ACI3_BH24ACI3_08010 [soil metagenome]